MLDEKGLIVGKKKGKSLRDFLKAIPRSERSDYILSDQEIMNLSVGSVVEFDVECYWNFFYVGFKVFGENKYFEFEMSEWESLNKKKLSWVMSRFYLVSFNGNNYDIPMIELALKECVTVDNQFVQVDNNLLKKASNEIINYDLKPFAFSKRYGIKIPRYNHIDIMPVAPLDGSLKLYGARLHCPRLQDLPYPEDHVLTLDDSNVMKPYCFNDLDLTELLTTQLFREIKLREDMSKEYGIDLRSKSDAQIAEAVICNELKKITGYYPQKPNVQLHSVKYNVPSFIKFKTAQLNKIVEDIANAEFLLDGRGSPTWPEGLGVFEKSEKGSKGKWVLKTEINGMTYKLGMGGLHSQEKETAHVADEFTKIVENDVASFYPRIVLNQGLFPPHLGEAFLYVYELIVDRRLDAKKGKSEAKDKAKKAAFATIADSLKIVINGCFGKLGERYSRIYAPQLLLQVTITGQLALLMLIEKLELAGIPTISANTDGVVSKYPKSENDRVRKLVKEWEEETQFETEETPYRGLWSRDVNNYIALKDGDGDNEADFLDQQLGFKTKGTYSERGSALDSVLSKNPEALVCTDAVLNYLKFGIPLIETIKKCNKIERFTSIRTVRGGAEKDGYYLGKVVRWYYPQEGKGQLSYVLSGKKVPTTDGAKPLMDLPKEMPNDVNYEYYEERANKMLYDLGVKSKPQSMSLF